MKFKWNSVSCIALMAGIAPFAGAQTVNTLQGPQETTAETQSVDQVAQDRGARAEGERVVVTGSLIATVPEDAPKPVEVYTAEDLENQGSPSVSEFIRSLTVSSYAAGQGIASDVGTAGFANVNLRGQGFNGSMVMLNGRNLATTNGGAGADINTIPIEALEAVEILKDGASATYGAGAVGGVINFRTRRDIDSTTLTLEKGFIDGSEGTLKADVLTGWVGEDGQSNLMLSASYFEEGVLKGNKRDWNTLPYEVNPNGWSTIGTNPGRWQPGRSFYTRTTGTGVAGSQPDFATADAISYCEALGGANYGSLRVGDPASLTNSTYGKCAMRRADFENLVNETTQYRVYGEFNATMSDSMEFHMEALWSKREEDVRTFPANYNASGKGPISAGVSAFCATVACNGVVPFNQRTYDEDGVWTGDTYRNPFVDEFLGRVPAAGSFFGFPADSLYASSSWRPFGFAPNPLYGDGFKHYPTQRERYQLTAELSGEFTEGGLFGFLNGTTYEYAIRANQYGENFVQPAILSSRLQNALLGYGGPNCSAIDRVETDFTSPYTFNRTVGIQSDTAPGTNGCEYFNPFASSFETSILGGANPYYGGPAYENSLELINWLHHPRQLETQRQSLTFDALWTGALPDSIQLPGGPIGWAIGTEWRQTEGRTLPKGDTQLEEEQNIQFCPWPEQSPGDIGCQGVESYPYDGAFFGTVATPREVGYSDAQGISLFGELQLPFTDRLNGSASFRHEDWNSGQLTGDIYSLALKYDLTDNLYVRASYGTNFRADGILNLEPGLSEVTDSATFTVQGPTPDLDVENFVNIIETISRNLEPETSTTMNFGIGYEAYLGEGRLVAKADFFRIDRDDQLATGNSDTVVFNVFGDANIDLPPGSVFPAADCNARLISFVTFAGDVACTAGLTAGDVTAIEVFRGNGPGFLTEGVDLSIDYSRPFLDGQIGFNIAVTENFTYESTDFNVNGILFEEGQDRLGSNNAGLTPAFPFNKTKGNATLRFANGQHRANLRVNYYSGFEDNNALMLYGQSYSSIGSDANGTIRSDYGATPEDYTDIDLTYIYTPAYLDGFDFSLSVLNLTDEDPVGRQAAQAYYTGLGNPRGRQVKLSVKKEF